VEECTSGGDAKLFEELRPESRGEDGEAFAENAVDSLSVSPALPGAPSVAEPGAGCGELDEDAEMDGPSPSLDCLDIGPRVRRCPDIERETLELASLERTRALPVPGFR